ncbi:MAG: glycosyltransferase family 4 protein [Patescibacteria group bacterium]
MNIGIVTQSFFPVRGGVSQHVFHTADELRRRGHQVTVITTNFTPFDHEHDHDLDVVRLGFNVTVPSNGSYSHFTVVSRLEKRLRQIEKDRQFDIVHIHCPLDPILPYNAAKTFSCPKVGTFHASTANERSFWYDYFSWYWRPNFKRLDTLLAVSSRARQFANKYFPGDYKIIPNGVDIKRFTADGEPQPGVRQGNDPVIMCIGRLSPRKGIRYFISAMPYIVKEIPNAQLVVVGGGFLMSYYKGFILPSVRQNIRFTGYATEAELPRYYSAADICCFPSTGAESFGIVLIEAMASGKPVIASAIPGYDGVVTHEHDGFLVPPKQPKLLARAIIDLIKDPDRQKRYIAEGLKTAEQYSWDRVVDQLEEAYQQTIEKKKQ